MAKHKINPEKTSELEISGTFNKKHPCVFDELFEESEFFDPRDLVQVKYEMLRRVKKDKWTVTKASETYGFSRFVYYDAEANFNDAGSCRPIAQEKGAANVHISSQMRYCHLSMTSLKNKAIARRNSLRSFAAVLPLMCIQEVLVEPLRGGKKNAEENVNDRYVMDAPPWEPMVSRYEEIRSNMIRADGIGVSERQGLSLILHRGLAAWIRAWITNQSRTPGDANTHTEGNRDRRCDRPNRLHYYHNGTEQPKGDPCMTQIQHDKVTPDHLKQQAYLYIRQSTIRQVFENSESTKRQYALKERAVALGWPLENIITIDEDLGRSGAESTRRSGFQRLVGEVGLDHVGIVMGLEVSRLARNSSDWHRLLEICGLTNTLILDEDGIYNPSDFNDRLILGLKGTMSEAELHLIKSRLQGGILSKAKRGELKQALPAGLVYNTEGKVILDPDSQVQETLKTFFNSFERTGSAMATVRHFQQNNLKFPRQIRSGAYKGELAWREMTHWKALQTLHNPRYAGAFCYGRRKEQKLPGGSMKYRLKPMEEWTVLLKDAHPGYISWQQYERNLQQLRKNSQTYGHDRRQSPPREGPALLQGLIVCGRCGDRMTLRYSKKKDGRQVPDYLCQREGIQSASDICQCVPGAEIDKTINQLILDSVTPLSIDVALEVQQELESRSNEVIALHRKGVETCPLRCRHGACAVYESRPLESPGC